MIPASEKALKGTFPRENSANVVKTFRTDKYFQENIWFLSFFALI